MRYVNDNRTDISIQTDVWQTWQFDLHFEDSFVEREMINVTDDIPGANLIVEGLETGEYKIGGNPASYDWLLPVYVVAYARNPKDDGFTSKTPTAQGVIANRYPKWNVFLFLWGGLYTRFTRHN